MHAKRTWRKKMSQHQTNLMWFLFSTVYLHRVTLYKAFIKMLTAATPWLLVFAYHTICSVYCSCICHQPTMGHATSHLRNKFGLSQREIEWTEGVRSQRDLHLLCGIAQLALHRHNLHNSLQSGFGFRWARGQPKTERKHASRHMVIQTKESESNGKSYLVWVTERIFIHHIPGCENSGCWSQSINTSLKSACGDCKANSIWSKVYNLHKSFLRSHVCNPSGTG